MTKDNSEDSGSSFQSKLILCGLVTSWCLSSLGKSLLNKYALNQGVSPITMLITQLGLQAFTTWSICGIFSLFNYDLRAIFLLKSGKKNELTNIENTSNNINTNEGSIQDIAFTREFSDQSTNEYISLEEDSYENPKNAEDNYSTTEPSPNSSPLVVPLFGNLLSILPFTIIHVAAHATSQFCLANIPIFMLKICKASAPLWGAMWGFILLGDPITIPITLSLILLCGGIMLTAVADLQKFSLNGIPPLGLLLGFVSACLYSLEKATAKTLYARQEDPYRLLITSNILACISIVPVWIWLCVWPTNFSLPNYFKDPATITCVILNGVIDSVLGISMLLTLQRVLATTHQVIQSGERLFVLVISIWVGGHVLRWTQWIGIGVAKLSMLLYGELRHRLEKQRKLEEETIKEHDDTIKLREANDIESENYESYGSTYERNNLNNSV